MLRCLSGVTSVKQNNDTALKSTSSHTVIGEGLIQALQELNQHIKYSFRPESKSANATVRSAPSEICLQASDIFQMEKKRKEKQGPESPLLLNKEGIARCSPQNVVQSLPLKASPAFEKYENAVLKLSKRSEITLC